MKDTGMQYTLAGFTHNTGFRVFAFEGVADDWVRTVYSVKADLALARKHGIRVQELPLLCRAVLERRSEHDDQRAFIFTEEDMALHSNLVSATLQSQKRKAPRRPFAAATPESAPSVDPAGSFRTGLEKDKDVMETFTQDPQVISAERLHAWEEKIRLRATTNAQKITVVASAVRQS